MPANANVDNAPATPRFVDREREIAELRDLAGVQQQTVQQDAEMRETKRGNREHRTELPVAVQTVAFDPRWLDLDVEEERRLFQDEHVRFLAVLAAREAHAAGVRLETP